jgi:hypothetical protein
MRFMVMVKATKESEAGAPPKQELMAAMMKFNEELVKAGVMLAGEGLHASSKGRGDRMGQALPQSIRGRVRDRDPSGV